jgi:hypothetical protein
MAVAPSAPNDFGVLVLMGPSSVEAEDRLNHAAHLSCRREALGCIQTQPRCLRGTIS